MSSFEEALVAWRTLLGEEGVTLAPQALQAAQRATFSTDQALLAILTPTHREQLPACMQIAQQHQIPIYPTSQGKNWGLGSRVPTCPKAVLLDLHKLDQIVSFDEELATITVEPGVTFQQVHDFLKEKDSPLFLAVLGGSPDSSLIGNAIERGDAIGPYGERLEVSCVLEVVLPNGELLHPGFGQFCETSLSSLYRWGLGPSCEGLFSQSNLGLVTQMTFWLMPKPQFLQLFFCELADLDQLQALLKEARGLLLREVIPRNCISFWNAYKLLARKQQFPFGQIEGTGPLRWEDLEAGAPWYASGALYCHDAQHASIMRDLLEQTIARKVKGLFFFDQETHPEVLDNNPFLGVPSDENIRSTYWRKSTPPPTQMDPDRDRCGALWLCPMLPLREQLVRDFIEDCEALIFEHGFEPNLGFGCPSGRVARMFVAINYDRDVPGEDTRAMACHDAIFEKIQHAGLMPYRLGIQSMRLLAPREKSSARLLSAIKDAVDPHHIFAPGRYAPTTTK